MVLSTFTMGTVIREFDIYFESVDKGVPSYNYAKKVINFSYCLLAYNFFVNFFVISSFCQKIAHIVLAIFDNFEAKHG